MRAFAIMLSVFTATIAATFACSSDDDADRAASRNSGSGPACPNDISVATGTVCETEGNVGQGGEGYGDD
jgi:hypothetical protein